MGQVKNEGDTGTAVLFAYMLYLLSLFKKNIEGQPTTEKKEKQIKSIIHKLRALVIIHQLTEHSITHYGMWNNPSLIDIKRKEQKKN